MSIQLFSGMSSLCLFLCGNAVTRAYSLTCIQGVNYDQYRTVDTHFGIKLIKYRPFISKGFFICKILYLHKIKLHEFMVAGA